jgi:hypothetical protein
MPSLPGIRAYQSHKARCVKVTKCAGDHLTMDCTRPRKQPAICANSGEHHPASYRGCLVHKKLQERQNERAPHRDEQRAARAATRVRPAMSVESHPPPVRKTSPDTRTGPAGLICQRGSQQAALSQTPYPHPSSSHRQ